MSRKLLIAVNPDHIFAALCENDIVVEDSSGYGTYIGQTAEYTRLAMYSVMRYEDGTEKQPNTSHSANGYPDIFEVDIFKVDMSTDTNKNTVD